MAYAGEYTPEITADYLANLQRPIQERGTQAVGRARGEALRRGLTGDPFEALRVGSAEAGTTRALADTESGLAYNVAGLQRDERMTGEQRTYQSAEAEKQRAFQEKMEQIQFNYQNALEASRNRYAKQQNERTFWPNLLGNVVGTGLGVYAGKKL